MRKQLHWEALKFGEYVRYSLSASRDITEGLLQRERSVMIISQGQAININLQMFAEYGHTTARVPIRCVDGEGRHVIGCTIIAPTASGLFLWLFTVDMC